MHTLYLLAKANRGLQFTAWITPTMPGKGVKAGGCVPASHLLWPNFWVGQVRSAFHRKTGPSLCLVFGSLCRGREVRAG